MNNVMDIIELTEKDRELLKKFPKYTGKGDFVGTREYYEYIFRTETNRDPALHEKFGKLHEQIVDLVIKFCKENNLTEVDRFRVSADGLKHSIKRGSWGASTDSSMAIYEGDPDMPLLYEI